MKKQETFIVAGVVVVLLTAAFTFAVYPPDDDAAVAHVDMATVLGTAEAMPTGAIYIFTSRSYGAVFLDGENTGARTPVILENVPTGSHDVYVHWGYGTAAVPYTSPTKTVMVYENQTANLYFQYYANCTVNVTVDPAGAGTVSGAGTYTYEDTVTLTATPYRGYSFDHWSRSGTSWGSSNPLEFTTRFDITLTAHFTVDTTDTFSLTVQSNPSGGGRVNVSPAGPYYMGDTVTLTAQAEPGYRFTGWGGDASGSDTSTTIYMDSDKTIIATFSTGGFDNLIIALLSLAAIGSVGLIAAGLYKRDEYDT